MEACKLRPGDRVVVDHERRTVLERRVPDPGVTELRLLIDPELSRPVEKRFYEDRTPIECLYRVCDCGLRFVGSGTACGQCAVTGG